MNAYILDVTGGLSFNRLVTDKAHRLFFFFYCWGLHIMPFISEVLKIPILLRDT